MTSDLKIVFIGTPDFAVASLEALLANDFHVVAVITAPDKPAGRGMQMQMSAVKACALKHGLPVLQPTNLKDPNFIERLRSFGADLQVVIAFRILPEAVWNMPRLGTMNLHASLLPDYRGAAPINHAIIQGEKVTGVSTFLLKHEIDTGDLLLQREVEILDADNAGTLHDKLMDVGAQLVVESVRKLASGNYETKAQRLPDQPKMAPKIFKDFCEINWHQPALSVWNHIRGLSPYPVARSLWNGKILKIYSCQLLSSHALKPGEFSSDGKTYIHVGTTDSDISITDLQLEGRKRMKTEEFLRGHTL